MVVRLLFGEKYSSIESFTYDGKNEPTLCFFPKTRKIIEYNRITFDVYFYYMSNGEMTNVKIGGVHLFFINEIDYNKLSPGKYQKLSDFNNEGLFYSLGTTVSYYYFWDKVMDKSLPIKLGDIILLKENFTQCVEKFGKTEFFKIPMGNISKYLVKLSELIFEFDDKANYLEIPDSEKLYANNKFAEKYSKLYKEYFEKMNSGNAAIEFLDFIRSRIYNNEESNLDYDESIVKKIQQKYAKNAKIRARARKLLNEHVRAAFKIIETIKNCLKVESNFLEKNNVFLGHYTSIATLKLLLENQKKSLDSEKIETDSIYHIENIDEQNQKSYMRLTNSRLMNDPLEGKVITNFLDNTYEQEDFLPSSIYMMCVTPNVDILPMWQQYGDSGAGAFIRLNNEYLDSIIKCSEAEIYRVCYITSDGEVHVSHMDKKEEDNLKQQLEQLKKLCERVKKDQNDQYIELISSVQEDISFLFKTMDYSYEEEYRIVACNSNKSPYKIKCEMNKDYPYPFLYIYLDDIKYEGSKYTEVIIGPKAIDIDFLGPYIHYLDPDIDIKSSKIPFR